jgi:hypothetical protein
MRTLRQGFRPQTLAAPSCSRVIVNPHTVWDLARCPHLQRLDKHSLPLGNTHIRDDGRDCPVHPVLPRSSPRSPSTSVPSSRSRVHDGRNSRTQLPLRCSQPPVAEMTMKNIPSPSAVATVESLPNPPLQQYDAPLTVDPPRPPMDLYKPPRHLAPKHILYSNGYGVPSTRELATPAHHNASKTHQTMFLSTLRCQIF